MATVFQSETCGRCAGSGHYSRNSRGSTLCYDCGGAKVRLTKIGLKAEARCIEIQTRLASTVKAGDNVWYAPYLGRARWMWVHEIIERGNGMFDIRHNDGLMVCTEETKVRTVRNEEDRQQTIAAALEYQSELIAKQAKRASTKEKAA